MAKQKDSTPTRVVELACNISGNTSLVLTESWERVDKATRALFNQAIFWRHPNSQTLTWVVGQEGKRGTDKSKKKTTSRKKKKTTSENEGVVMHRVSNSYLERDSNAPAGHTQWPTADRLGSRYDQMGGVASGLSREQHNALFGLLYEDLSKGRQSNKQFACNVFKAGTKDAFECEISDITETEWEALKEGSYAQITAWEAAAKEAAKGQVTDAEPTDDTEQKPGAPIKLGKRAAGVLRKYGFLKDLDALPLYGDERYIVCRNAGERLFKWVVSDQKAYGAYQTEEAEIGKTLQGTPASIRLLLGAVATQFDREGWVRKGWDRSLSYLQNEVIPALREGREVQEKVEQGEDGKKHSYTLNSDSIDWLKTQGEATWAALMSTSASLLATMAAHDWHRPGATYSFYKPQEHVQYHLGSNYMKYSLGGGENAEPVEPCQGYDTDLNEVTYQKGSSPAGPMELTVKLPSGAVAVAHIPWRKAYWTRLGTEPKFNPTSYLEGLKLRELQPTIYGLWFKRHGREFLGVLKEPTLVMRKPKQGKDKCYIRFSMTILPPEIIEGGPKDMSDLVYWMKAAPPSQGNSQANAIGTAKDAERFQTMLDQGMTKLRVTGIDLGVANYAAMTTLEGSLHKDSQWAEVDPETGHYTSYGTRFVPSAVEPPEIAKQLWQLAGTIKDLLGVTRALIKQMGKGEELDLEQALKRKTRLRSILASMAVDWQIRELLRPHYEATEQAIKLLECYDKPISGDEGFLSLRKLEGGRRNAARQAKKKYLARLDALHTTDWLEVLKEDCGRGVVWLRENPMALHHILYRCYKRLMGKWAQRRKMYHRDHPGEAGYLKHTEEYHYIHALEMQKQLARSISNLGNAPLPLGAVGMDMPKLSRRFRNLKQNLKLQVASQIAQEAVRQGSQIVVLEQLQTNSKTRGNREENNLLSLWSAKQVQEAIQNALGWYQIGIQEVTEAYTSQVDAKTGRLGYRDGRKLWVRREQGLGWVDADGNASYNIAQRGLTRNTDLHRIGLDGDEKQVSKRVQATVTRYYGHLQKWEEACETVGVSSKEPMVLNGVPSGDPLVDLQAGKWLTKDQQKVYRATLREEVEQIGEPNVPQVKY